MRAAIFKGPGAVEVGERPDPVIQEPTDAVVRVVLGCVCGSDLWYYRGESPHAAGPIGHEFIGVVEQAGADVHDVRVGDLVVAPFIYSDMSCPHCLNGSTISCPAGGNFGNGVIDGGRARRCASRWLAAPWSRCPDRGTPMRRCGRCWPCPT
jgi:threonine dehydrogenase-like Zn-dependent dehydrogenase